MTLNELLIVKAALVPINYEEVIDTARVIIEREIRLKELERTLNTKEGNAMEMKKNGR